jgi:hypothetical protein
MIQLQTNRKNEEFTPLKDQGSCCHLRDIEKTEFTQFHLTQKNFILHYALTENASSNSLYAFVNLHST